MYYTVFYIVVQLGVATLRHPSSTEGKRHGTRQPHLWSGRIAWRIANDKGPPGYPGSPSNHMPTRLFSASRIIGALSAQNG